MTDDPPATREAVARLHRIVLGRAARGDELDPGARSEREIAAQLTDSAEFRGSLGPGGASEALFRRALGEHGERDVGDMPAADLACLLARDPLVVATLPVREDLYPDGFPIEDEAAYNWWLGDQKRQRDRLLQAVAAPAPALSLVIDIGGADVADVARTAASAREGRGLIEIVCVLRQRAPVEALSAALGAGVRIVRGGWFRPREARRERGLRACRGRFVARIEPGDEVESDLGPLCARFGETVRIALSDGDELSGDGASRHPRLCGAWDPDGARAAPPAGLVIVARALALSAGGFGPHPDVHGDWDFLLRCAERTTPSQIRPLAVVGLHRMRPPEANNARLSVAIVEAHLRRARLVGAQASAAPGSRLVRVTHPLPRKPPLASIVIPTRDKVEVLRECVEGIRAKTDYAAYEILIVDNGSVEPATHGYFQQLAGAADVRVLNWDRPFNWGAINNFAIAQMKGEIAVLLNNDTKPIRRDWLDELVRQASRPDVGIAGARLLFPDGRIQHAGMALSSKGATRHLRLFARPDRLPDDRQIACVRTVSAVTGACMAVRRSVLAQVGGIESEAMQVTWSDVDLCFKVRAAGYRVVCTPYAELYHWEQVTRGSDDIPAHRERNLREFAAFKSFWGRAAVGLDPHLSPYLSAETETPTIMPGIRPAVLQDAHLAPTDWENAQEAKSACDCNSGRKA